MLTFGTSSIRNVRHDLDRLKMSIRLMETNLAGLKETLYEIEERMMDEEDKILENFLERKGL